MNPDVAILRGLHRAGDRPLPAAELLAGTGLDLPGLRERVGLLRESGFEIREDGAGYRLVRVPEHLVGEDIEARLRTERLGRPVRVFRVIDSTNDLLLRLGDEGHPEGIAIFAEEQRRGRGRQGRSWFSPAGRGLWFSVLMRPDLSPAGSGRLTAAAGLAVADAVRSASDLPATIKWPNDILIGGRKVAGILLETRSDPGRIRYAVVGIGVNVDLESGEFPEDLRGRATSLARESGRPISRPALAARLIEALERRYLQALGRDFGKLAKEFCGLCETIGRTVRIRDGETWTEGEVIDMDLDGALRIRTGEGRMITARNAEYGSPDPA